MIKSIKSKPVDAVVFDAYGTIFDVHAAVLKQAAVLGPLAQPLSDLWRSKQLEYTWVRSLSDRYASFWQLTEQSLDYAIATLAPEHTSLRSAILEAYRDLDAYSDAAAAIHALRSMGFKTAILSNGDADMLERALSASHLSDAFDAVLSVDSIGVYKTAPAAYRLVEDQMGIKPQSTAFVSSNRWDIAGASVAGFHCVWLNRLGRVDEYADMAPAANIRSLDELLTD
jgi:2-haloacid dehalogenase